MIEAMKFLFVHFGTNAFSSRVGLAAGRIQELAAGRSQELAADRSQEREDNLEQVGGSQGPAAHTLVLVEDTLGQLDHILVLAERNQAQVVRNQELVDHTLAQAAADCCRAADRKLAAVERRVGQVPLEADSDFEFECWNSSSFGRRRKYHRTQTQSR